MIKMGEISCLSAAEAIESTVLRCSEPDGMGLDAWAVAASWATAALTLGLLIAAALAARAAIKTLRQMERDSIAQSRPYVYAQVVPGLAGPRTWDLIVKNAGQSAARNLTAKLSSWPKDDDFITEPLRTMFTTPQTLPPGTQVRTFWHMKAQQGGQLTDPKTGARSSSHGFGDQVRITLSYQDDNQPTRTYLDEYDLNMSAVGLTPLSTSGPDLPSSVDDPNSAALYKILGTLVRQVGELRR